MVSDQRQGILERMVPLALVGLLGLGLGAAGGIWFAQRYLTSSTPLITGGASSVDQVSSGDREDAGEAIRALATAPPATRPATSRPATVRAVLDPDHHAQATPSPARQGRMLFTCTSARHIDATAPQPGKCYTCGETLVPVEKVDHGLRAIAYYARQQTMPRRTAKPEHPPLYTCATMTHIQSTSDRPGQCAACGLDLLRVEQVGHASRAVAFWTQQRQNESVRPGPRDDPRRLLQRLFTCPDIAHVEVTGLRPSRCTRCGLEMSPLDQIVHSHAVQAIEAFIRKVETARAGQTTSRPSATRPVTASSVTP